jgi:molybdopterin molybdotransferase
MTLVNPGWDEARDAAFATGRALPAEIVRVGRADRRILAEDVRARTALPPRDASAMDGWAVGGEGPWRVVADLLAGELLDRPLAPGEAVVIATGAALPAGATGVLRSERGEVDAAGRLHGDVEPGQDVRPAGEEAHEGLLLIPSGTPLTPADLGLAAAAGHDELLVVRRPRARVLVFGDELLRSGLARDGKVRDSLGAQVPAWLRRMGVDVVGIEWVADTLDAHARALDSVADAELVVTSGGTAAGPVDHLRDALAHTGGRILVDTVAVRPGGPMMLGRWPGDRWLIGLPGNPQAAIAALLTLGSPLLDALHRRAPTTLASRRLAAPVASRDDRTRLVPCADVAGGCMPTDFIGSGMLRGLAAADGFAVVPRGRGAIGDEVRWLPLPG